MNEGISSYPRNLKPGLRWWWFADPMSKADIDYQLNWIHSQEFGTVEIAWIYPTEKSEDTPHFLSKEWTELVTYAAAGCRKRGIGCDFTFGTLWPFGGVHVPMEDSSKTIHGYSSQRLDRSWDVAHTDEPGLILDHLSEKALKSYAAIVGDALQPAIEASTNTNGEGDAAIPALFCDSWEVEPEDLWAEGFSEAFFKKYRYKLEPIFENLDEQPEVRFDYRMLISQFILDNFYKPYDEIAKERGALSRVQCHGAPTDLIHAYSMADIPESEALLFDPGFSVIAASAAAQSGKRIVSSETFTCLYGWTPTPGPSPGQGNEQIADLKLLADALFANGINWILWHGMPFNGKETKKSFYTTTHVGPDSSFIEDLAAFNNYMQTVSKLMTQGIPETHLAVYLPLEDAFMKGDLPEEKLRASARWHWEMHYDRIPDSLRPYRPIWTSLYYLKNAEVDGDNIILGHSRVSALYIDAEWLEFSTLAELVRIAEDGGTVVIKRKPKEPGTTRTPKYDRMWHSLESLKQNTIDEIKLPPRLVNTTDQAQSILPDYWCRFIESAEGPVWRFFFAHPRCTEITYPMTVGQSLTTETISIPVEFHVHNRVQTYLLEFTPYRSLILDVASDRIIDKTPAFIPKDPSTSPKRIN